MAGIDWLTGKKIDGFAAVVQSLEILFTTRIGSRVMIRPYGANAGQLLGQPMLVSTFTTFRETIMIATELWEPRFRVHVGLAVAAGDTPETMRLGQIKGLELWGEYRPRGHLGDPTPEGALRRVFVGQGQAGPQVVQ